MLASQIFAWISVMLCLLEVLRFAARISRIGSLNRFFHRIHIPCGVLLLMVGISHGLLAGNFPDAAWSEIELAPVLFTINWGSACFLSSLFLAASYLLRKRLRRYWMPVHRVLTVMMAVFLIFHLMDVGIHLPERWTGNAFIKAEQKHESSSAAEEPSAPLFDRESPAPPSRAMSTPAPPDTESSHPAPKETEDPVSEIESSALSSQEEGLADGVYTGSAPGRNGPITVNVTVVSGKITEIRVIDHTETPRYYSRAEEVIDSILSAQSTEVDAVTGATISSEGIKAAVANALGW